MNNRSKRRRYRILIFPLIGAYIMWAILRPLPDLMPTTSKLQLGSGSVSNTLNWPTEGQAAVGVSPSGVLAEYGDQVPIPVASNIKVLTAMSVLQKHPLKIGETGPVIPITERDIQIYNDYVARNGSVMLISAGTGLTQYQMLQALMLPSANNIADALVAWAFGSHENFVEFANTYSKQLGMINTRVGADASGLDPGSVSTARDLVILGQAAMQNPVLAEIAGQKSAVLPVAGTIINTNYLLGTNAIVGLKTGNSDEAGGAYLSASKANVEGKEVTIITSVIGAPTRAEAMRTTLPLIDSAAGNFGDIVIIKAGAIVGHYDLPWGGRINSVAERDLTITAWKGADLPVEIDLGPVSSQSKSGATAGTIELTQSPASLGAVVPAVISNPPPGPSVWWRLTHPFYN